MTTPTPWGIVPSVSTSLSVDGGRGVRRSSKVVGAFAVLVLGVTCTAPSAYAHGVAAAPSGAPPDQVQQQPVSATVVTLITGDVVQLSTFHDGKQSATVRPGPLSSVGSFVSETRDGHTYEVHGAKEDAPGSSEVQVHAF